MGIGAGLLPAVAAATIGLVALGQSGPAAAQELPGGTWGTAIPVSLTAAVPAGTQFVSGSLTSVSCASPGNCAAIGTVSTDTSSTGTDTPYPVVLSETGGTWGPPETVAGITSTTPNQGAVTADVSCAAPGDCAATWTYDDASGDGHAYLIDESGGTWGQAQPVTPGTISNSLDSISCPAPGDCTAVGGYLDGSTGSGRPFAMDSSGGTWGAPQEVSGTDGLSSPSPVSAGLTSVSCASAGNCVAGGVYRLSSATGAVDEQVFLATETGGTWGQAQQVAGVAALDSGGWSNLRSVSCAGSGECAAIGVYKGATNGDYGWAATESGGSWAPAQQLPAPAASSQTIIPNKVSCATGGYCVVAGEYPPASTGVSQAFTDTYSGGAWTAQDVPGLTGLRGDALNVSCAAPGYCAASGYYYPAGLEFVTDEATGTWGNAHGVTGLPAGEPEINDLSCTAPGYCTAVGLAGATTFTVSEATAATVSLTASAPTVTYGDEQAETLTATVTSPDGGTPTGTITVADGTASVCRITLSNGSGTCALPATALPGGTDQLTAVYDGDASYAAASASATVTVAKAATTPVVTVSPATVTFGTSYKSVVSVAVKPQFTGTPVGGVDVYLNGRPMCGAALTAGKMSCDVTGGQNAGRYAITASYNGDGNFAASTSAAQYLTVAPSVTYSGTIRLTKMGLCLDDRNNSTRNGAVVQVWQCNGAANQKWQVWSDGTIRHNGLCLDAENHGTANGTKVQLWACTGAANQQWDTRSFRIHYDNPAAVNAAVGKVLDDTGHGGNGTQQQIWTSTGGTNQIWATS
jgi:ricin-type beta-trefoil lectin protein/Big-like domain-containing protein